MEPIECCYSREHEWVRPEAEGTALIGITDYAQKQLGDVVFLNLPEPGVKLRQFQKFGEIESVKAVSDLFSPVSGLILEVNHAPLEHPELVNREPYVRGWLLKVKLDDPRELERLMSAQEYQEMLQGKAKP